MSWTVTHNPMLGIIEVAFNGFATGEDLKTVTLECSTLGDEKNTAKVLVDIYDIEMGASIVDIMDLTRQFIELNINRLTRIALILPKDNHARELIQFYETVCVNRGWFAKIFTERPSAVDWLLHAETGSNANTAFRT